MNNRVLIVDDNHELAENIAELLADEGYETSVAFSSEQALKLAQANNYHIVLADIRMPGMNGVELIEVLGTLNPEATFLLMTAYTSDQMLTKAMLSGVEAILPKPLAVERLLQIMPKQQNDASLLLVEDDPTLVRVFSEMLENRGYAVRTAMTFASAKAELAARLPDAAVIDVCLPDGNGAELAYELCTNAGIPVVMITGYDHDGVAELVHSMLPSTTRYLAKPFDADTLLSALRSFGGSEQKPQPGGGTS